MNKPRKGKVNVVTTPVSRGGNVRHWAKILRRSGGVPVKIKNPERYLSSYRRAMNAAFGERL